MTDLLERLTTTDPDPDRDLDAARHRHTDRCWWHPDAARWVCPPNGTA
jgi:hypothetical protein